MEIHIKRNISGKYELWIDGVLISDKYTTCEKAASKAKQYAKGQNK